MQWDLRHYCGISLRADVLRVGASITAREVLELLWEMPDDGALMASIRSRPVVDDEGERPRPKAAPDSWQGRLLARRKQRGWSTDRWIAAGQYAALAGQPWPNLPDSEGAAPHPASGGVVVDLDQALP